MLRAIPDMLASYWDMLDRDPHSPDNWINAQVPPNFACMDSEARGDFLIDMFGPWYASYFATWLDYAARAPGEVLVLDFEDFRADPAQALEQILAHSGFPTSRLDCQMALNTVWEDRKAFRFNRGGTSRSAERFSPAQLARLRKQLSYYPNLDGMVEKLVPNL